MKSLDAKTRVLIAALVAALVIGVAACVAAQGNARASAENVQAAMVKDAVSRVQASNSTGYNAVIDILGRQSNASEDRQWLLANDDAIVYVRDVSTTNGYGGLPVESYPGGDDVARLLDAASGGKVNHGTVTIDGREYLGSATRFAFDGISYGLCLLTAVSVLDDVTATAPMTVLYVLLAVALVLLVAVPTLVAARLSKPAGDVQPDVPPAAPEAGPALASATPAAQPDVPPAASEAVPAPASAVPAAQPDPVPEMLPLRPRSELEDHLLRFLDSGTPGGNLVKITCNDEEAMRRVLLRLGSLAAGSDSHCYDLGGNSFVVELFEIDEARAREALAPLLQGDAAITAFLPIDER